MSIKDKMTSNQPYASRYTEMDDSLKDNARNLLWEYNSLRPTDYERRAEILRNLLGTCSPMTFIESTFKCDYGFNIHTEGFCFVNYNCVMLDSSPIHIGEGAFIGPGTVLSCAGHAIYPTQRVNEGIGTSSPITLGKNVWIGANCTICGGVTIGEGSVIGAGSVVTKGIPSGVVAAGVPCKVIREITEDDKIKL